MNDSLILLFTLLVTHVVLQGCHSMEYQPSSGPRIVAHRGASADAPENTIASFRLGFDQGADAVEGDFQLTMDGHIVAMHDGTLSRTTGDPREIDAVTLEELESLGAGNWGRWKGSGYEDERIPTLSAVLQTVPADRGILIEIKDSDRIVPILLRDLEQSGISRDRVTVISFDQEVISAMKQVAPVWRALWLTSFSKQTGEWRPTAREVIEIATAIGADGVDVKAEVEVVDAAFVRQVKGAGLEVHVWTVNDVDLAGHMTSAGVDSITTDRPAMLIEGSRR